MRAPLLLFCALTACAPMLPNHPVERALVRDIARIVDVRDQQTWYVDEIDVSEVLDDAMRSSCIVDNKHREAALAWLDERIEALGGDAKEAWHRSNREKDEIEELLLMIRTKKVLQRAHEWAGMDRCPFWDEVDPEFSGLQTPAKKIVAVLEGGGRIQVGWQGGKVGIGGGGGGRLLLGYGINDNLTFFAGIEGSGAARFTDLKLKERIEVPAVLIMADLPLVLRTHGLSTHFDFEIAPVGLLNQLSGEVQFGGQLGVGAGISRLLLAGLMPGLTLWANVGYLPAKDQVPSIFQIGAGLRGSIIYPF